MNIRRVVIVVGLALALPACSMFPLGPDLARAPTPFGDAPVVQLVGDDGQTTEIRHGDAGDTAVLNFDAVDKEKTFDAGITWLPISSGGDPAHDYWLGGVNIFRTADRSAYVVLRYPHGLKIARPMKSDTFETIIMTCQMRGVDPAAAFMPQASSDDASSSSSSSDAPQKPCDFATRADLDAFVPEMMTTALKAEKAGADSGDDSDYHWQKVTVVLP